MSHQHGDICYLSNLIDSSIYWRCSIKKVLSKVSQNPQENTNVKDSFFNKVVRLTQVTLSKEETPTHVFSFQLCEIFQNIFFAEHLQPSASLLNNIYDDHTDVRYENLQDEDTNWISGAVEGWGSTLNSQENACARVSFLIKLQAWGLQLY